MDKHAHEPNDPKVKAAYNALISDVKQQWDHAIKDAGIHIEPSEADPYDSYEAVRDDVLNNKRLKVFTGGNPLPEDHPLAAIDPETGLSYNTMLRAVHDLNGHIAGNNDFSEAGEAGATHAHRQMFSEEAVPALLNETEGQVSQFFHGKEKGNFPPQNATLVPEEFVKPSWVSKIQAAMDAAPAGGLNPATGESAITGVGSEIYPEARGARERLDHRPTTQELINFYDEHKALFEKHPQLSIGWDKTDNGWELNIGAVGTREGAMKVGRKLDQRAVWDIDNKEEIPTGGTGRQTNFANYPLEQRLKDLQSAPSRYVHYSSKPVEGGVLSGERRGEAAAGSEAERLQHENKVPGVYAYREGSKEESQIRGRAVKSVIAGSKNIADISGAEREPFEEAHAAAFEKYKAAGDNDTIANQKALNDAEAHLRDLGYDGYEHAAGRPGTVFLFGDHPVESVGGQGPTPRKTAVEEKTPKGSTIDLLKNPIPRTEEELALFADKIHKGLSLQGTTLADFQKTMGEWVNETAGKISQPSALLKRAVAIAANEITHWIMENGGEGKGWYRKLTDEAIEIMKQKHPSLEEPSKQGIFKALWAAHSYGTNPDLNMREASQNFSNYEKNGRISYDKGILNPNTGETVKWSGHSGNVYTMAKTQALVDSLGEQGAVDWLTSKHTWPEIQEQFKNTGLSVSKSGVAFDKEGKTYGANAFGPKGGPFFLNLMGINDHTVVDIWGARSLRRWEGRAGDPNTLAKDPQTGLVSDKPPTTDEIKRYHQIAQEVGKKLGLDLDDVQALQWYYEHKLYEVHGAGEPARDYKEAAQNVVSGKGPKTGPITAGDLIAALQSRGNAEAGAGAAGRGANAETPGLFESNEGRGGPTPRKALLERLPKNEYQPNDVVDDIHHELGHAIVAAELGMSPKDGVLSDRHPENLGTKALASMPIHFPPEWFNSQGDVHPENGAPHIGKIITMYMAGGAAEEVFSGIPMDKNPGIVEDLRVSREMLKKLGFSKEGAEQMIKIAQQRAKNILSREGVSDVVKKYSGEREEDLPNVYHMSKDRVDQIIQEIKDDQAKRKSGAGATAGGNAQRVNGEPVGINRQLDAAAKSGSARAAGKESPELKKAGEEPKSNRSALLAGAAALAGPLAGGLAALLGKKKEKPVLAAAPPSRQPLYTVGNPIGLVKPGNIDLSNRPIIQNEDGTHSSEYSVSFGTDDGEVLVPTVVNGRFLTPDGKKPPEGSAAEDAMKEAARQHFIDTGENMGTFDTWRHADAYASRAHRRMEAPREIAQIVDEAARSNGIPAEIFRAQIKQESGNKPNAVSNKGAKGAAQLMDPIIQEYGVEHPFDPEDNILAGARYMADLHRRLGHWDRALAAYNAGADRVKSAVEDHGNEWLDYMPEETQNYVRSILRGKK